MKYLPRLLVLAAAVLVPALLPARDGDRPGGSARVTFLEPAKFTDVRLSGSTEERSREVVLEQLQKHLAGLARRALPAGQTLEVEFSDIDLAGQFEPWRGPQLSDVRFVREIYPPRLVFKYKLVDAAGATLAEGSEKLTDLAFTYQMRNLDRDETHYEKTLLGDWFHRRFPAKK